MDENNGIDLKKFIFPAIGCSASSFLIIFCVFTAALITLGIIKSEAGDGSSDGPISYGEECGFTISSTSLSKTEFKSKLTEYANSTGSSNHTLFAENADNIYDIATSENINPELVVVRAVSEGFDPGNNYNYWGIGCTNTGGGSDCKKYSSFSKGVQGFINTISKYSSLQEMMSKYAYIGKFWYNPGSSSLGGCYYAPYIYGDSIPDRVKNACSSSVSCTKDNTTNCIATTDEDQAAYANWQVSQMAKHRKTIFGLSDDTSCSTGSSSNLSTDFSSLIAYSDAEAWSLLTGYSSWSETEANITQTQMDARVTSITIPIRVWASTDANNYETKKAEKTITVNKALSDFYKSLFTDLYNEATEFVINPSECYCYNYRLTTSGTRLSSHSYGTACDLNWSSPGNGYGAHVYTKEEWNKLPENKSKYQILYKDSKMIEIMHRYTLSWGGEWTSVTDAMHFSFIADDTRATLQSKY